jgi:hypothetical protein
MHSVGEVIERRLGPPSRRDGVTAPYWVEAAPDSTAIHRIDRASGEETPVASLWVPKADRPSRGGKRPMYMPQDSWAVGAEGRVTVVRANGYSVDWYLPDGSIISGPPNDAERFPVGSEEKEAAVEYYNASATFTMAWGSGTIERTQSSRGLPSGHTVNADDFEWPDLLPIFRRVLVSPRGEAWVERYMPAGGRGRAEIFNEQGVRTGFIELPDQARVIGFAAEGEPGSRVYVARTDDVGLIWLEGYRVLGAEG